MTPQELMDFLDAAHLTAHVNHPLPNRGGIFLVGPPEAFKTSILDRALKPYPEALVLSDTNVQQLAKLRPDFSRGRYTTLAFREFSKLFERDPRTASNLLGSIRALADEGFTTMSFEDPRMGSTPSRVLIIGCMTEDFYHHQFSRWEADGFARRFIWCLFQARNVHKATDAIIQKQLITLDGIARRYPGHKEIPFDVSDNDGRMIKGLMKEQRGQTTPVLLMAKIISVLKWKYVKEPEKVKSIIREIESCFTKTGGVLVL